MPKHLPAEIAARNERLAALARQEKATLADFDRVSARLASARARRAALIAQADEELADLAAARDAALGAYARCAGAERAAVTLGEDVRELRRLARETATETSRNGQAPESTPAGPRRTSRQQQRSDG